MSLPERLGRLRRIDRIGAGGFATVWLYQDDELDSLVAVKALADNWAIREDVCDRFLEEARILRRADSDHVVRVYDIGEVDGTPYFVMSYADRGSVADLVQPGESLPPARVVDLLAQAGDGIAVLHRHGVIHRDIKPQNLLLRSTPEGGEKVLVADLGVAKAMLHASGLTQVVGTPAYMAPEQAIGIGLDFRADVHALGAVGYHLLTGRLVRDGGFGALLAPTLPPPPSAIAAVPSSYDGVVMRALATNPDDRWPDVPSFVAALREAERSAGQPSPVTVQVAPPQVRRVAPSASEARIETLEDEQKGSALRLAGLALLVLLVAFGAAYGVTRVLDRNPTAEDPKGQGESPSGEGESPTSEPAADIDFPALAAPADYEVHVVRTKEGGWNYLAPTGWVAFKVKDNGSDAGVLDVAQIDEQRQVRWRPEGEPAVGGYSLRVEAITSTESVAEMVAAKVDAFVNSPDLVGVELLNRTNDTVYFTFRDGANRLRYNFFRWVADAEGLAGLEISVTGRKADESALSDLLDSVSGSANPS
ncbi:serine/threonine-protein kinase [Nocardioides sp. WS12]|uniref:serine/threonine-protein kinase n=1 Tax=Nocardioides sp. WS12 TaxID=2486272 RepID=UPI0015FE4B3A|nr:serine/threonine-protein kinase [Nocardioides sp. WS12]